jgi:hypothetical protein
MQKQPAQENGFINILCNILLPIMILNNLTQKLGAMNTLLLALTFPLCYGFYDGIKRKKTNFFSLLGIFNTLLTGGLAVLGLGGIWFAVKEAAFPLLIGIFVFFSSFSQKPFIRTLFVNPQVINIDLLMEKLKENQKESDFFRLMKVSTIWLSASFFLSALLNFVLAQSIFVPTETGLDANAQSEALNHQIADMTKWSMLVILLPSMVFLLAIFWQLLRSLSRLSGLTTDQILPLK